MKLQIEWSLSTKDSGSVLKSRGCLSTYLFSTLYVTLPHNVVKNKTSVGVLIV